MGSPSYMYSTHNHQGVLHSLLRRSAPKLASTLARWWHLAFYMCSYWVCKTFPRLSKFVLIKLVMRLMPGQDSRHFSPRYNPWDQRLCRVGDGDMFTEINKGSVSVVTAQIGEFTETGIRTTSGQELPADIIVSATGFNFMRNYPAGRIGLLIDGRPYKP